MSQSRSSRYEAPQGHRLSLRCGEKEQGREEVVGLKEGEKEGLGSEKREVGGSGVDGREEREVGMGEEEKTGNKNGMEGERKREIMEGKKGRRKGKEEKLKR